MSGSEYKFRIFHSPTSMEPEETPPVGSLLLSCEEEDFGNDNKSEVDCHTLKGGGQTSMESEAAVPKGSLIRMSSVEENCGNDKQSELHCHTLADKTDVCHDHAYAALRDNYRYRRCVKKTPQNVDMPVITESTVHDEVVEPVRKSRRLLVYPIVNRPDNRDYVGHQEAVSTDRELNNVTRCEACDLWLTDEAFKIKHMSQAHSAMVYELKCGICRHSFPIELKEDKVDWKDFLTDGVPLLCPHCKKRSVASLTRMASMSLMDITEQPMFWCNLPQYCSEKTTDFHSLCDFVLHKETEHGTNSTKVVCTQNKKQIKLKKEVLKTIKHHKKAVSCDEPNKSKKSTRKPKPKLIKRFKCYVAGCIKEYSHVNTYNYHLKSHLPGATNRCKCSGCERDLDKQYQDMCSVNCIECNHKHIMVVDSRNQFLNIRIGFVCLQCNKKNRARPVMKTTDPDCQLSSNIAYICSRNESCQAIYQTQRQLALHESSHIGNGYKAPQRLISDVYELKCGECGNIYYPEFKRNYVYLHEFLSEGILISCLTCNKRSKVSLTLSDSTPEGVDTQKCPMLHCSSEKCYADESIIFRNFLGLSYHKAVHHTLSEEREIYTCNVDDCMKRFYRKEMLEKHMKCHELGTSTPCRCRGCLKVPMKDSKIVCCEISCDGCAGKFTINTNKTSRYITSGIGFLCPSCNKRNSSVKLVLLNFAKPKSQGLVFMCSKSEDCQRKFLMQGDLSKHESSHSAQMLECDKCGKNVTETKMRFHKHRYCNVVRQTEYPCQICKKVCNGKYALISHIRKVHTNIKKRRDVMCEKCGKQGIREMTKHVKKCHNIKKTRTPTRNVCAFCGKDVFRGLQRHIRKYHPSEAGVNIQELATFRCDMCAREFRTKILLQKHLETHISSGDYDQ